MEMERIIDYWSEDKPATYELYDAMELAEKEHAAVRISWEYKGSIYQVIVHSYTTIATAENSIKKIKVEEV